MKRLARTTFTLIVVSFIVTQISFAIGDQHGVFRSQSTQGAPWKGTATIEEETFRITVHPNYLDVELEWVFRVGGQEPEKFQDALEIVGNLNLVKNSVVVGMLTWWKGDILKGKLKTTQTARADYEEVVQRDADAPPPPRDPVLIEYGWGLDNYDISIFPAKFGETRKVRIHYLIPASSVAGEVKIPYPHAFTANANVSIKAGADIVSYKIETRKDAILRENKTMELLSKTDFSFKSHGGMNQGERISYIVLVLPAEVTGSRFYVGDFSNTHLQGQAGHIVVMDAKKIIAQSNLQEDFVILWNWSHTKLLQLYAGQIVSQSKLLKSFLAKLEGANKRVALIINKEGGDRVTFTLSKIGDPDHTKMLAYLDSLAVLAVQEPPFVSKRPNYQLQADVKQAQSDFESAIKAAISLFEKNDNIRHLLVLTAGPSIIYNNTPITIKLDSAIHISGLADYAEKLDVDMSISQEDRRLYWPGINPWNILTQQTLNLDIEAVVSNGNQLCTLAVASSNKKPNMYQSSKSELEKHVFSSPSLTPKVSWKIRQEDKVIASFDETPEMVPVDDVLALTQIMGASRALTPMTSAMPRSMAATVGFIDSAYSLVALEEDKLPLAAATQYAATGIPDLLASDIKADPKDLTPLSIAEWIKESPPQKIWTNRNTYSFNNFNHIMLEDGAAMPMVRLANIEKKAGGNAGAFMPMPIAGEVSASPTTATYADYSKEISTGILSHSKRLSSDKFAKINGSRLTLNLAKVNATPQSSIQLDIYDLKGDLIFSKTIAISSGQTIAEFPHSQISHQMGVYIIQVKSINGRFRQKLLM